MKTTVESTRFWVQGLSLGLILLSGRTAGQESERVILPERVIERGVGSGGIASMVFSPDNKILATGVNNRDNSVVLWDVTTGQATQVLKKHANGVTALWFSSEGGHLQAACTPLDREPPYSAVKRWDVVTGTETNYYTLLGGGANRAFSPDGKLLMTVQGYPNKVAKVWQIESGKELASLEEDDSFLNVQCAAFSRDGKLLATGGGKKEGRITVWDGNTFRVKRRLESEGLFIRALMFSPQGDILASYGRARLEGNSLLGGLELWDTATGKRLKFSLTANVDYFQFSPDGKTLAVSYSEAVYLWTMPEGRRVAALKRNRGQLGRLAFSPDGSLVAASNGVGDLLIWRLPRMDQPTKEK